MCGDGARHASVSSMAYFFLRNLLFTNSKTKYICTTCTKFLVSLKQADLDANEDKKES